MRSRNLLVTALLLVATLAIDSKAAGDEHDLVVFAAASLKEAFGELAKKFEADHAGEKVVLNLAGSQELRAQIEHGARADVLASADMRHMMALAGAKLVAKERIFARNEPVVVVPSSNPAGLARFEDLPKAKRLVVGAAEVPIGGYTVEILRNAGERLGDDFARRVEANIVSRELNVRQILAKVALGEADAGFVYRTDVAAASGKVSSIEIPAELNVIADYPIAVTAGSRRPEAAKAWIDLVLSETGQGILEAAGFRRVPAQSP